MSVTTEPGGSWRDEVAQLEAQIGKLRQSVNQDSPYISERTPTLGSPRMEKRPSLSTSAPLVQVPLTTSSDGLSQSHTSQGDAISASCPVDAFVQPPRTAQPSENSEVQEMFQELEKLEIALVQEKQNSKRLMAEKAAMEKSHGRDMVELESMLKQCMEEVEGLRAENRQLLGLNAKLLAGGEVDATTTTFCTASEAEIDSSGAVLDRMVSMGHLGSPKNTSPSHALSFGTTDGA